MSHETKSLAARADETFAAVRSMDTVAALENSERHVIWEMKPAAKQIVEQALCQALHLHTSAQDLCLQHRQIDSSDALVDLY